MQIPSISPYGLNRIEMPERDTTVSGQIDKAGKTFQQVLGSLSQSEENANDLVSKLAMGEDVDIHQVMIATEENDVNFRITMAIRDRLVDAYREVMRMSI